MKARTLFIMLVAALFSITCTSCKEEEILVVCDSCSAWVSETAQYCSDCGSPLSPAVPSPNTTVSTTPGVSSSSDETPSPSPSNSPAAPSHEHVFSTATCEEPSKCTCGEIGADALGHDWTEATCEEASQCTRCAKSNGNALGHAWKDASCSSPKTCSRCNATDGSALGHNWKDATCSSPKTCSRCNTTDGSALGHNWKDATCSSPKTCSRCNTTDGSALGHNWKDATCSSPKTCLVCAATEGGSLSHNYAAYSCIYCGMADKSHAYEYMIAYVKKHGSTSNGYTSIERITGDGVKYKLSYSIEYGNLSVSRAQVLDGELLFSAIYFNTFFYGTGSGDLEVQGYISPSTFTSSSELSCISCTGGSNPEAKAAALELARICCCEMLNWLSRYLIDLDVGITLADLGFTAY